MSGLKLNHVSKRGHWASKPFKNNHIINNTGLHINKYLHQFHIQPIVLSYCLMLYSTSMNDTTLLYPSREHHIPHNIQKSLPRIPVVSPEVTRKEPHSSLLDMIQCPMYSSGTACHLAIQEEGPSVSWPLPSGACIFHWHLGYGRSETRAKIDSCRCLKVAEKRGSNPST